LSRAVRFLLTEEQKVCHSKRIAGMARRSIRFPYDGVASARRLQSDALSSAAPVCRILPTTNVVNMLEICFVNTFNVALERQPTVARDTPTRKK
jgi:hypothetical protein